MGSLATITTGMISIKNNSSLLLYRSPFQHKLYSDGIRTTQIHLGIFFLSSGQHLVHEQLIHYSKTFIRLRDVEDGEDVTLAGCS